MERDLEGKVALITGATGGMGQATAIALAKRGVKVVIAARREAEGAQTVQMLRDTGSDGLFIKTDVTKEDEARQMVDKTVEAFGRLDFAFNNAGSGVNKPITELSLDEWNYDVEVNLTGVFLGVKAQLPAMAAAGGGAIVNMSSQTATYASPGYGAYAAAKSGVEAFSRVAAIEGAKMNGKRIKFM
jgi:NAD(P)-dependent dehydrogenase (short-subunit alcohol dehydrogenase family)